MAVSGCTELVSLGREEYDIGMSANAFLPRELVVGVGETVVWKNDGSRAHTVTAYDDRIPEDAEYFASGGYNSQHAAWEAWHSHEGGNLYSGERYEHVFDIPGRYEYFCVPHERHDMAGTIVVENY